MKVTRVVQLVSSCKGDDSDTTYQPVRSDTRKTKKHMTKIGRTNACHSRRLFRRVYSKLAIKRFTEKISGFEQISVCQYRPSSSRCPVLCSRAYDPAGVSEAMLRSYLGMR